jgi:hypothetical protein
VGIKKKSPRFTFGNPPRFAKGSRKESIKCVMKKGYQVTDDNYQLRNM